MSTRDLYQEMILEHNRKPRNWGELDNPDRSAEGLNPLCGDHIWLNLKLTGETIDQVAFHGESCAICKASASMMTGAVKGKTLTEAEHLVNEFRDMATGQLDTAAVPHKLGRLTVFAGVRNLPARVKCAILPWHTLAAAMHSNSTATTEGEHEPIRDA